MSWEPYTVSTAPYSYATWNVLGEDCTFFSQGVTAQQGACVARCQLYWRWSDAAETRTHPIQCGQPAALAPCGTYLCPAHIDAIYHCQICGAWLADWPDGGCATCAAQQAP